jgi:hypothetical protein
MFWYNEITIKSGDHFDFNNLEEANELMYVLEANKIPYTVDQNSYSDEVFITSYGDSK